MLRLIAALHTARGYQDTVEVGATAELGPAIVELAY